MKLVNCFKSSTYCSSTTHLIRLVEQADPTTRPQRAVVVGARTLAELVRLDVLQSDDALRHDTPVPVSAEALFPWKRDVFLQT